MTLSTVRGGADTHVRSARPNKNFGRTERLRVQLNTEESLLRQKSPAPKGAKIGSAFLYLTQAADAVGTNTLSVRPLAADFEANSVTFADKPGVTGATATLSKTGSLAGTVWAIDVTAIYQDISNGAANRGLSIRATTAGEVVFYSLNAESLRPYLEVSWSTPPQKPTLLKPSFAATSLAKWVQSCDFADRNGDDALVSVQVQIDPTADWTGGDLWDSGTVPAEIPQLDLARTDLPGGIYPGLALNATTTVRMRLTDSSGGTSPWSDPVTVTRKGKGTVTLNAPAPAPNNTVAEFTPPITWANAGLTQTHYRVTIAKTSNPKKLLLDTGRVKSTSTTYTVPKRILSDEVTYTVWVYVWDDQQRESTVGDPTYVAVSRDFTVLYSAVVTAPSALTATQPGIAPWVDLTVTRASSPDSWTFLRKETGSGDPYRAIDTDVVPADIDTSPTTWVYRDNTARPGMAYTYLAKAEVNGVLSTGGPTAQITPSANGVWLLDPITGKQVILGGKDFTGAAEDQATTYTVLGAIEVVRTVMGLTGLSGDCTLLLRTREGVSWREYEKTLYEFKSKPTATFRLVLGDLNIPVILGDILPMPHPESRADQVLKVVSFKFWQNGEHPFEVSF